MPSYRVRPRVWVGVLTLLAYLAVFYGVWLLNGIDYLRIGDSAETLWKWYVVPMACGAVVLVVLVSLFGWWRPALFEDRARMPRWVWIVPVLLAVSAIVALIVGDTSAVTAQMWLYLIVGSVLVGFNEEMATRGQLIVTLRSRFGERGVWFLSTLMFALLHLPNTVFGTGVLGLAQVPLTFLAGSVFYLLRRVSGTLIWAMALHALWDFSSFAAHSTVSSFTGPLIGVAALIVALVLTRSEGRLAASAGPRDGTAH